MIDSKTVVPEEMETVDINPLSQTPKNTADVGKSRQLKALVMKTLHSQKRAWFTNICCITLCPLLMVLFAAIFGIVISGILQRVPIKEVVYCSNVNAMNDTIKVPFLNVSDPSIPVTSASGITGTTGVNVSNANYNLVRVLSNTGPPGAATASFSQPCVNWFGEDYPITSLYEQAVNSTIAASKPLLRDSTYTAEPLQGWFGTIAMPGLDPNVNLFFTAKQLRSYYIYGKDSSVTDSLLGGRVSSSQLSFPQFLSLAAGAPNLPAFVSPQSNASIGLLGTIPTRYWLNFSLTNGVFAGYGYQQVPLFNYVSTTQTDMDDAVSNAITSVLAEILKVDKSILQRTGANRTEVAAFFLSLDKYLQALPHGGVYFTKVAHSDKAYEWTYNIGYDKRFSTSTSLPTMGLRALYLQTALDNAILRNGNISALGNTSITQGFRSMPQLQSTKLAFPFEGLIGDFLYPLGISFLLTIFVVTLVKEKEERIAIMMQMNGLKLGTYYFTHYVTFFILFFISSAIFIITGKAVSLTMFTQTEFGVLFLMFFLWGNAQIALAFFFAALFNRSRIANISIILVILCSVIIAVAVDRLSQNDPVSLAYFVWPPFAFYRTLGLANRASYTQTLRAYRTSDLVISNEITQALLFLVLDIFIYGLLAIYFNLVLPKEFGTRKPWHFPVTDVIKYIKRRQSIRENNGMDVLSENYQATNIAMDEEELKMEDSDVKAERDRVLNSKMDPSSPLIMKHLRKIYPGRGGLGPKLAVKDITLSVDKDLIFGLLGPNGSGKTTLISCLTGLFEPSSGEAILSGYNIRTQIDMVYRKIGVCPQFDILWEDLTVGEHLYFYARLKGVSKENEGEAVQRSLEQVSLQDFVHRLSKGLSGGEKRRLSIAIALVGQPAVVFLDEPTTGLDPEVRRLIWDIISKARVGKTIVLTTHSMEEAEALCGQIGIMAKGTLRCLANPLRLKEIYGSGFKLFFNSKAEDTARAARFIESLLPSGWKKVDAFATNVSYEFPTSDGTIGALFDQIESGKAANGILDWGLGQTTLEEVFIRLISDMDAQAAY